MSSMKSLAMSSLVLVCVLLAQNLQAAPRKGQTGLVPKHEGSRVFTGDLQSVLRPMPEHGDAAKTQSHQRPQREQSRTLTDLMYETFEGSFPADNDWNRFNDGDSAPYAWDDDNARANAGSWACWCADIAFDDADDLDPEDDNYPNNLDSWMIYGPFDLSTASEAYLMFDYWNLSEENFDEFSWMASTNGTNFSGYVTSGDSDGWQLEGIDFSDVPTLGNLLGEDEVYIAFIFESDGSVTYEGAWVDEVEIAVESGVPDIDIIDIWTEPANPVVGEEVDLYVTFENIGDGVATDIDIEYYIDYLYVDDDGHSELQPGESRTEYEANYIFTESGSHSFRVIIDAVNGETYEGNNIHTETVNVSGSGGSATVYVRRENGALIGSGALVYRYDASWNYLDMDETSSPSYAYWSNIPAGTYQFEAYDDNQSDIWGYASYWGTATNISVSNGSNTTVQLFQSMPYVESIVLSDNELEPGDVLHVDVSVVNPGSSSQSVTCRILADRSRSSSWDYNSGDHGPLTIGAGSTSYYGFDYTIPSSWDNTTLYVAARCATNMSSSWTITDGTDWDENLDIVAPQPPDLSITSPENYDDVSTSTTIRVNGEDWLGNALNFVEYYIDGDYKHTDGSPGSGSPASTWTWDTETISNGAHSIAAVGYDEDLRSTEDDILVNVVNVADVDVTVLDDGGGDTGLHFDVVRYDENYEYLDLDGTNSSGVATWSNVDAGEYYPMIFEAYDDRETDLWGTRAYWGGTDFEVIAPYSCGILEIERSTPYCESLLPEHLNYAPGETVHVDLQVYNPGGSTVQCKSRIRFDDDLESSYLHTSSLHGPLSVSPGGRAYFGFDWTLPDDADGTYYLSGQVQTLINGSYQNTDNMGFIAFVEVAPTFRVDGGSLSFSPDSSPAQGSTVFVSGSLYGVGDGSVQYRWSYETPDGYVHHDLTTYSTTMSDGSASIGPFSGLPTELYGNHAVWAVITSPNSVETNHAGYTVGRDVAPMIEGDAAWLWQEYVPTDAADRLNDGDIEVVFLRVGHFRMNYANHFVDFGYDETEFDPMEQQQLHATYSFGEDFIDHLESDTETALAEVIAGMHETLEDDGYRFPQLVGIDLDAEGIDVDTYKILLDAVFEEFGSQYLISLSPQNWMIDASGYEEMVEHVDFIVPMCYDYGWANDFDANFEVTDPGWILQRSAVFENSGLPYYVGIPTYSYYKIYDASGDCINHWPNLSQELLIHGGMTMEAEYMNTWTSPELPTVYSGDNINVYTCSSDTPVGAYTIPAGGHVCVNEVGGEAVLAYRAAAWSGGGSHMLGTSLFAFHTTTDAMLDALEDGVSPTVEPVVDYTLLHSANGLNYVELALQNRGPEPSRARPSAAGLHIRVTQGWFYDAIPLIGDFDDYAAYQILGDGVIEVSDARTADFIEVYETRLEPGEEVVMPELRVTSLGQGAELHVRAWAWSLDDPIDQPGHNNPWWHEFEGHNRLETKVMRDPVDANVVNDEYDGTAQVVDYACYTYRLEGESVPDPVDLHILSTVDQEIALYWGQVLGASSYEIHASNRYAFTPGPTTLVDQTSNTYWMERITEGRRFYRVLSSTDVLRDTTGLTEVDDTEGSAGINED